MSIDKGDASPNLPADFPGDIPVVGSSYIPWTASDGGKGIQVADATDSSFDDAVKKLTDAGYQQFSGEGGSGDVRMATFANDDNEVSVVGANVDGQARLTYTVTPPANR